MNRFMLIITAEYEKAVGDDLMESIYSIIRARGCRNISTSVHTLPDKAQYHFDIPDFMRKPRADRKGAGG